MSVRIINSDALTALRTLPERSVQCVVTSPPYMGLRNYGTEPQVWGGDNEHEHQWGLVASPGSRSSDTKPGPFQHPGNTGRESLVSNVCTCGAWRGELGLEPTPALFIEHLVEIFEEVRRVLRDDGVLFVNIGDSYANDAKWGGSSGGKHVDALHGQTGIGRQKRETGVRAKSLFLIPERFAIGMADRGWIVRSQIVWAKKSAMPESVRDRPTSAWEPIWMFTKQARYFWDQDAVREPLAESSVARLAQPYNQAASGYRAVNGAPDGDRSHLLERGANIRNVWHLGPEPSRDEHYAAYPTEIPRRCILAATSEKGQCPACSAPWRRVVERDGASKWAADDDIRDFNNDGRTANPQSSKSLHRQKGGVYSTAKVLGWEPSCKCDAGDPVPQTVLDPFLGSGTTALVADRLERNAIGIELSPKYAAMARRRIEGDAPLFADVEVAS